MKLRVTKRAQAHIDRAALWWDQNRPLAPGALDEEVADAFSLLSAEPGIGAPALNARAKGVRRVHLERVHYYLYYRVRRDQVECWRFGTPAAVRGLSCSRMRELQPP